MSLSSIVVLGGGSAGLIAAITIKRIVPGLDVRVIRSREIGIIGVGEGTTPYFPGHLHQFLRLPPKDFMERAQPIWKLGIRYFWGSRREFNYSFDRQTDWRWPDLPRNNGFYCDSDFADASQMSALMDRNKVFVRDAQGRPEITVAMAAYHIENVKLVDYLEWQALQLGVTVTDGTVRDAGYEDGKVTHLQLESGERVTADLYVDASGFHAKLIGQTLNEPFLPYSDTLFCDRAVVGPRDRDDGEPIQPYTTAETMDHGWCWRIDHEQHINRGYVYSSAFVSDEDAEAEFRRLNPKVKATRLVRFRSGRYRRFWVGNVVAVGNAAGFVEPLEATSLMILCLQCRTLVEGLVDSLGEPPPTLVGLYNEFISRQWDEIRDFLAIHYRFNTRRDTPFWQHCRNETPLHGAARLVDYYRENGPSLLAKTSLLPDGSLFGIEGYYAMLVGQQVPHAMKHDISDEEVRRWQVHRAAFAQKAETALSVREALSLIRDPRWVWKSL